MTPHSAKKHSIYARTSNVM